MPAKPTLIVCLTGAECTGKTTLAEALALRCGAPLVPEAARRYLARRASYGQDDVLAIAREQMRLEQAALASAPPLVLCDTDLLVVRIWWEAKFGPLPEELAQALAQRSPRAYLLTKPDIPWAPDPLRESGGDRAGLHRRHQRILAGDGSPYAEVGGDLNTRLDAALRHVRGWLNDGCG